MTKRDLFILIIKLFALYALITSLFGVLPMLTSTMRFEWTAFDVLYLLAYIAFFCFLFYLLTIKSDKIVDLLKLDKGFDSDFIQFGSIEKIQIIQLGLIITGGLIFISDLPELIVGIFNLFKANVQKDIEDTLGFMTPQNNTYLVIDFIRILMGYLILTNHEYIAKKLL
ncbi:MAG: hypothetical protein ACTHJT_04405 [Cytophaga sp.]|uniref:hypothetical protein n=1 Tax=Cytophaga sp. TaxID=29535 RepID=UPI003F7CF5DE